MQALLITGGIFLIGILLAYGLKRWKLGDNLTLVTLMAVPLVVLGVASGKLAGFTAPGGWGATFHEEARSTIEPFPIDTAIMEGEFVEKGGYVDLAEIEKKLDLDKPIALTLQLGRGGYYQAEAIAEYIKVLSQHDPDMSVVVIDTDGKYVASTSGKAVLLLLQQGDQVGRFMNALAGAAPEAILGPGGFTDKSISYRATNVQALEKMQAENTSRLVAVSGTRTPDGIVLRDLIVTRLLVGLAAKDE